MSEMSICMSLFLVCCFIHVFLYVYISTLLYLPHQESPYSGFPSGLLIKIQLSSCFVLFHNSILCNSLVIHWFLKQQTGVFVAEAYVPKALKTERQATADQRLRVLHHSATNDLNWHPNVTTGWVPKGVVDRARKEKTESRRFYRGWASPGASW